MNPEDWSDVLLAEMNTVFLATLREDGPPNVRALSALRSEGLRTIWMISGSMDKKTRELENDPRCMIYAATLDGESYRYAELRLWGTIEIIDDTAAIESIWNEVYDGFFSEGGRYDPTVRILKFTASSGEYMTQDGAGLLRFEDPLPEASCG